MLLLQLHTNSRIWKKQKFWATWINVSMTAIVNFIGMAAEDDVVAAFNNFAID